MASRPHLRSTSMVMLVLMLFSILGYGLQAQAENQAPAAPGLVSACTDTSGAVIELQFDKAMADPSDKQGQFSVNNGADDPVLSAGLKNGNPNIIILTLTTAIKNGETVSVSYKAGVVAAADGGVLADFNQTVTNQVTGVKSIAEARQMGAGQSATVKGIVTYVNGASYFIQDETAGINVYVSGLSPAPQPGDQIQVNGSMALYQGLLEFKPAKKDVAILSSNNTLPVPKLLTIDQIGGYESQLIRIENVTLGTINTNGQTTISDGVNSTVIFKIPALNGINAGDKIDLAAIVSNYNGYELLVRNAGDITKRENSAAPALLKAATNAGGTQIELIFDKAMADPNGKQAQFSVNNGGDNEVTAAALKSSDAAVIILTLKNAVLAGQAVKVSYTAGDVAAADTTSLATFTGYTATNTVAAANEKSFDIVEITDLHGSIVDSSNKPVAGVMASNIKDYIWANNPTRTLILAGGDNYQGTAVSNLEHGKPVMKVFNSIGLAASALGNHEFDWGLDAVTNINGSSVTANYPILCANLFPKGNTSNPIFEPYKVFTLDGVKVAVVGAITASTPGLVLADNIKDYDVLDPVTNINKYAGQARTVDGAELVIVLIHEGDGYNNGASGPIVDIAHQLTGVDAVLGGHTHTVVQTLVTNKDGKSIPLAIANYNGKGFIDWKVTRHEDGTFSFNNANSAYVAEDTASTVYPYGYKASAPVVNQAVQQIISDTMAEEGPILNEVLGSAKIELKRTQSGSPYGESLAGNWATDVIRSQGQADFAFQNNGGLRCDILQGPITMSTIYQFMPFDNVVMTCDMTGAGLKTILEQAVMDNGLGIQLSGLKFTYDPTLPSGSRVLSISKSDGTAVNMNDNTLSYQVATNDFLAGGTTASPKDGFTFATNSANMTNTYVLVRDALADAVKAAGTDGISAGMEGRIQNAQNTDKISKVTATVNGDASSAEGFTWYTGQVSMGNDLQVVEASAGSSPADFSQAVKFTGVCSVSTNSANERVHKARATGLKPGTQYYYRVGDEALNIWSATGSFKTAPKNGAFTFIDLTDTQALDKSEATLSSQTIAKALSAVNDASFVAVNGDIVETGNTEAQWDWMLGHAQASLLSTTIVPATGNHEKQTNSFIDHFNLNPATGSATGNGAYYSYDYSNAHFLVLNTNENSADYADFSPAQLQWMKDDVKAAKATGAKWIIAILHKGPYTTSNHATDTDIMGASGVRTKVAPVMASLGIDLVLQGHDHIYARSKPIKADGTAAVETQISESFKGQSIKYIVNPDGTIYLIPGAAGAKVYYKNQKINDSSNSAYVAGYYDHFDVADENHAAPYGSDPSDASRLVRGQIQNFEGITVNGDKLSVVSYEIDQSKNNAQPYVIDTFGISKKGVPINNPQVDVSKDNKDLAITSDSPGTIAVKVPADVKDATVNVGALLKGTADGKLKSNALPKINVSTATGVGTVEMNIPAGATVSASDSSGWDGTINVPVIKANNTVTVTPDSGKSATVKTVIEMGFGDVPLTFDQAVRILIPGQAGNEVGFYRQGVFTKIDNILPADTQLAANALDAGKDGKINVGTDLVVWTKHFTSFVTYTQTTASSVSSGGGGGYFVTTQSAPTIKSISPAQGGAGTSLTLEGSGLKTVKEVHFGKTAASSFKLNTDSSMTAVVPPGSGTVDVYVTNNYGSSASSSGSKFTYALQVTAPAAPAAEPVTLVLNDISGHWAEPSIRQLIAAGVVSGYGDQSYRPDGKVTRAEFVTLLVKAYKLPIKAGKVFTDTRDCWAQDNISTAYYAGIASGYNEDGFGPNDPISREQMAVMIAKAAKLNLSSMENEYTDAQKAAVWAQTAINAVSKAGIFKGYSDNTFRPKNDTTRAEAAVVITNMLK